MHLTIGDIVLLSFPYTDGAGKKFRPGLALNVDANRGDVLIGYMTSMVNAYKNDPNAVSIRNADLAEGTLDMDSVVWIDKTLTVADDRCRKVASLGRKKLDEVIRKMNALIVRNHYRAVHKPVTAFTAGGRVQYGGRVYDEAEMVNLADAGLDFWLTAGRYSDAFESGLADFLGIDTAFLVNSRSYANLVAVGG